jgi:hypothetical chaperone protein
MRKAEFVPAIGIDFGTTNTVIAVTGEDGRANVLKFSHQNQIVQTYQSALCFWEEKGVSSLELKAEGGLWAIDKFLEASLPHRFVQSFKTFAASKLFQDTRIFRRRFEFEDLLQAFFETLLKHAGDFSIASKNVVVGRPVRFAGSSPDERLAMRRYGNAFARLGIVNPVYVYEPVGAAFFFAQRLEQDATVLVADFGGGTSDFSVMRFERSAGRMQARQLGHAGIGIAGDTFDYRMIDHVVSPALGKDTEYRSFDKLLTLPNGYFANFARWSQLALMKSNGELRELKGFLNSALEPDRLQTFINIIENDLGFALYQSVSNAKFALSSREKTNFSFCHYDINIKSVITRKEYETWLRDDLAKIAETVANALENAKLNPAAIDKVFLTGGTSFMPAIRQIFVNAFGEDKLATGDQFESIAYGLALIGGSENPTDWSVKI